MERLRVPTVDLVVALGLAAWGIATSEGLPAVIAAVVLMTIPLAWRRRAPVLICLPIAAGFVLQAVPADPPESLATLVAVMLAAYSVAAFADRRGALAGTALLLAGGVAEAALASDDDYGFIVVVLGVAAVAGYAIGARSREAERDREREAALAVAAERERIARELHDSVAHAVSLMVVQAGAAETAADREGAAKALERIRQTGQEAVADLGRMVGLLRSGDVEPVSGLTDPERLVEPFRAAGLDVDLDVQGDPHPLPGGLDAAAYRIAQEALTNALKHGAGSAALTIGYEPEALHLCVTNPVGPGGAAGTGHGVAGMRERARLYGGELHAGRDGNGTFEVEVRLPVPAT